MQLLCIKGVGNLYNNIAYESVLGSDIGARPCEPALSCDDMIIRI